MQQLHESLLLSSGGLSRAKVVGRQISHEVQQLQKRIAEQERMLGALAMEPVLPKPWRRDDHGDRRWFFEPRFRMVAWENC